MIDNKHKVNNQVYQVYLDYLYFQYSLIFFFSSASMIYSIVWICVYKKKPRLRKVALFIETFIERFEKLSVRWISIMRLKLVSSHVSAQP